ncbi:MAG: PAS domain-containing protein [Spirochaetes bacterium]|nr:PAS domain-containing protein [Spirochaetota bacterium]
MISTGTFLTFFGRRQKAEARISHSEAEFRALSDNALTGVLRLALSGKIFYANRATAHMFGFDSIERFIAEGIDRMVVDRTQASLVVNEVKTVGQIDSCEIDLVAEPTAGHTLLCSGKFFDGIMNATLIDITERLRETRVLHQFSRAIEQMGDTVVITSVDSKIEYVNPTFEKLSGYTKAELLGQSATILSSGGYDAGFSEGLQKAITSGQLYQNDFIIRKKTGELFTEAETVSPLRDLNGNITNFVSTGRDLTERLAMEESLQKSEAEYRLIANNTSDIIWVLDLETKRFTYVSPSVERYRGFRPQEVMEQTLAEALVPEEFELVEKELPRRIEAFTKNPECCTWIDELLQIKKDGSYFPTEISTTFVMSKSGKLQIIGISRDITERKKAKEVIRKIQRRNSLLN